MIRHGQCRVDRAEGSSTTQLGNEGGAIVRAEEGDESIGELAGEAAEAKKELKESTEAGAKVQQQQQQSKDSAK
jgi:hypothetical protein